MSQITRYDRIEACVGVDDPGRWTIKHIMRKVDVVWADGGPQLVGASGGDPGVRYAWGSQGLTYEWRHESASSCLRWYLDGALVAQTVWTWPQSGWCDARLGHYRWPSLAEQVVFEDALVWTCIEWKEAIGRPLLVEARDRLGFVCASLEIRPFVEQTWGATCQVWTRTVSLPQRAATLEAGRKMFVEVICEPEFGALRPLETRTRSSLTSPRSLNRPQRALAIWEGPHVLYHSPTYNVPMERVGFSEFEQMVLEWWRGDGARDHCRRDEE